MGPLKSSLALAAVAIGLGSGCGEVIGLEDKPCEPGCTPSGERLVCVDGVAKTETCSSDERCSAGDCIAPMIAALNCNACTTDLDGNLWCWGVNDRGQLGSIELVNDGTPVRIQLPDKVREVSVGTLHVCALTDSHEVYCWGDNSGGQSDGGKASLQPVGPSRVLGNVTTVSAGTGHTCALSRGRVYCWGSNGAGQCGRAPPDPAPALGPGPDLKCQFDITVRVEPNDAVHFPTAEQPTVEKIVVQKHTSCALADGKVYCWGSNCGGGGIEGGGCDNGGQLGFDPAKRCYSAQPLEVPGAPKFPLGIGLGHMSGFAFATEGRLSAWGWGQEQLGVGKIPKEFVPVTAVVGDDAEQLMGVNQVVRSNGWHTFAHTSSGFFSWGENTCGELGHAGATGDGADAQFPSAARADWVPTNVDRLATGQDFTCYLDKANQVFCFGSSQFLGQKLEGTPFCYDEDAKNCGSPNAPVRVKLE